jgi:murein DD-endopeptidase MepM/ murein hydrolase activator NlpD
MIFNPDPVAKCTAYPLPEPDLRLAAMSAENTMPTGWPLQTTGHQVISGFGPRGRSIHNGVDIKADYGSPVHATAAGLVVFSGVMNGYGNIVILDHDNGYQTAYAHLKDRTVEKGDNLSRGARVGHLGRTGRATTHHVHYEVRRAGKSINPMPFIHGDARSPEWREIAANTP